MNIKLKSPTNNMLNTIVVNNYSRLKPSLLIFPIIFLMMIVLLLYQQDALSVDRYVQIQNSCFIFLNSKLSSFPELAFNLTQVGDALVPLSLLSIFIVYAPKLWEGLISSSLISCVICCSLKEIFAVPRPAAVFDHNSFVIIGTTLSGRNSLPSGHSITIFTVLTALVFAFMPQQLKYKILWFTLIVTTGLILAFTRVGVGAHYPLDVVIGATIGYISGLLGIIINQKYNIWTWVGNKKYYPVIILFFLFGCVSLVTRMMSDNLIIYYFSFIALIISLYKIISIYVKK